MFRACLLAKNGQKTYFCQRLTNPVAHFTCLYELIVYSPDKQRVLQLQFEYVKENTQKRQFWNFLDLIVRIVLLGIW